MSCAEHFGSHIGKCSHGAFQKRHGCLGGMSDLRNPHVTYKYTLEIITDLQGGSITLNTGKYACTHLNVQSKLMIGGPQYYMRITTKKQIAICVTAILTMMFSGLIS